MSSQEMKESSLKTDMLHTEVKDRDRIGKDLRKTRKNKYLLGKNRGHGKIQRLQVSDNLGCQGWGDTWL